MFINILGFQLGWFACVLGGANQLAWLGVFIALLILSVHVLRANDPAFEVRLLLSALIIGLIFDGIPKSLGWITFAPVPYWPEQLSPPWMVMLWGLFASTINISLSWLKGKQSLAIIIGAIAGPLTYWSGARLGALQFGNFNAAMIYLSIGWAIAVPVLLRISIPKNH